MSDTPRIPHSSPSRVRSSSNPSIPTGPKTTHGKFKQRSVDMDAPQSPKATEPAATPPNPKGLKQRAVKASLGRKLTEKEKEIWGAKISNEKKKLAVKKNRPEGSEGTDSASEAPALPLTSGQILANYSNSFKEKYNALQTTDFSGLPLHLKPLAEADESEAPNVIHSITVGGNEIQYMDPEFALFHWDNLDQATKDAAKEGFRQLKKTPETDFKTRLLATEVFSLYGNAAAGAAPTAGSIPEANLAILKPIYAELLAARPDDEAIMNRAAALNLKGLTPEIDKQIANKAAQAQKGANLLDALANMAIFKWFIPKSTRLKSAQRILNDPQSTEIKRDKAYRAIASLVWKKIEKNQSRDDHDPYKPSEAYRQENGKEIFKTLNSILEDTVTSNEHKSKIIGRVFQSAYGNASNAQEPLHLDHMTPAERQQIFTGLEPLLNDNPNLCDTLAKHFIRFETSIPTPHSAVWNASTRKDFLEICGQSPAMKAALKKAIVEKPEDDRQYSTGRKEAFAYLLEKANDQEMDGLLQDFTKLALNLTRTPLGQILDCAQVVDKNPKARAIFYPMLRASLDKDPQKKKTQEDHLYGLYFDLYKPVDPTPKTAGSAQIAIPVEAALTEPSTYTISDLPATTQNARRSSVGNAASTRYSATLGATGRANSNLRQTLLAAAHSFANDTATMVGLLSFSNSQEVQRAIQPFIKNLQDDNMGIEKMDERRNQMNLILTELKKLQVSESQKDAFNEAITTLENALRQTSEGWQTGFKAFNQQMIVLFQESHPDAVRHFGTIVVEGLKRNIAEKQ
jgi:hypothetical protein